MKVEVGYQSEDCFEVLGLSQQDFEGKEILIEGAFDLQAYDFCGGCLILNFVENPFRKE